MSFQSPAFRTLRRSVEGMEGMHSKMFDPPKEGLATPAGTPDRVNPTNPVPEVMLAAGLLDFLSVPHTVQRQLMHGMTVPTFDGRQMEFFVFRDPEGIDNLTDPNDPATLGLMINPKQGAWPSSTIRMPRGVVFHCQTDGSGPPPHTIHWHGHEPTPMNDGVGHCSMEIGSYTYQLQPNFIGSYFHHCHRNTVQHFEFGLYGFTIVEPPDAYFATQQDPAIPIGACTDGKRRTAANLVNFPRFGQTAAERVPLTSGDPHAYTVAYDAEAIWVFDDRDINWSILASDARATFPVSGTIPGVNDNFFTDAGALLPPSFFSFNDFRSTHFYVTGFPVPDDSGLVRIPGQGQLAPGILVPPELMSGVGALADGTVVPAQQVQVSINAKTNQNILLRALNGAYNNVRVTFPVDIVIIAWDGRALGVPPFGNYNAPVLVPRNTPMEWSVARRLDCLIRESSPIDSFATVEFIDTLRRDVRFTARIPITISNP